MSAGSEWAKLAVGLAADVVGGLIRDGQLSAQQREAAERNALRTLLDMPDPKLLTDAYAAAKAKGPAK